MMKKPWINMIQTMKMYRNLITILLLQILLFSCSSNYNCKCSKYDNIVLNDTNLIKLNERFSILSDCDKLSLLDSLLRDFEYKNSYDRRSRNALSFSFTDSIPPLNDLVIMDDSAKSANSEVIDKRLLDKEFAGLVLKFITYFQNLYAKDIIQEYCPNISYVICRNYGAEMTETRKFDDENLYEGNILLLRRFLGCSNQIKSEEYFLNKNFNTQTVREYIYDKYNFYRIDSNSLVIRELVPGFIYNIEFYSYNKWNYFIIQLYFGNTCWDYENQIYFDNFKETEQLDKTKQLVVNEKCTMINLSLTILVSNYYHYYGKPYIYSLPGIRK